MMSGRLSGKVCVITDTGGSVGHAGTRDQKMGLQNVTEFRIYLWRGVSERQALPG